jgi:hypothetical protein
VRAALSHKCPDGNFEQVVREAFKLVLERDRRRKALTERPHAQSEAPGENDRYVPAAVKRAVWEGVVPGRWATERCAARLASSSSTTISK